MESRRQPARPQSGATSERRDDEDGVLLQRHCQRQWAEPVEGYASCRRHADNGLAMRDKGQEARREDRSRGQRIAVLVAPHEVLAAGQRVPCERASPAQVLWLQAQKQQRVPVPVVRYMVNMQVRR